MDFFSLTSDASSFEGKDAIVVNVPSAVSNKKDLMSWYTVALRFPDYFGENWDALDECLRDLSWVKERHLVIFHSDMPLNGNPTDQVKYIDVLASAVRDWLAGDAHKVTVAFHPACESRLRELMRR